MVFVIALVTRSVLAILSVSGAGDDFPVMHEVDGDYPGAAHVQSGDFDGDGDLDLAGAGATDGTVVWWENLDGAGTSWARRSMNDFYPGARSIVVGDLDGDGDLDTAGASTTLGVVSSWINYDGDGSLWIEWVAGFDFAGAFWTDLGDVDGDGDLDIAGAAFGAGRVAWFENVDGLGVTWLEHPVASGFSKAVGVVTVDLDEDGDVDLAATSYGLDRVTWYENGGDGLTWTAHAVATGFDGAVGVDAGDIDGDGDLDLVGAANFDDAVSWFENTDGTALDWTEHVVDDAFDQAEHIEAVDIDGDGDVDLLAAGQLADEVSWWENDGTGLGWTKHVIDGALDDALASHAADLDGDGDLDVAVCGAASATVRWWEQRAPCPGDLDESGSVGVGDLLLVLGDWGCAGTCNGDADGDGTVGVADLLLILGGWGSCT